MTLPVKFNFRATAAYVTDAANTYPELFDNGGMSTAYPKTDGGIVHGWEVQSGIGFTRDRNSGNDARLAGIGWAIAVGDTYRIDLPAAGSYSIGLAIGDPNVTAPCNWTLKDGTTSLKVLSGSTSGANTFKDANGTEHTAANWPTNNTEFVGTFATTTLRLVATSADARIAHISVTAAAGDTTAPTLTVPTGTSTGSTTGSGTVTTNEANGTLYFLASINATETAATVKASGGTQAITTTGSKSVSFTVLTASTTYYAHFVHRDAAGNDSTVSNSTSFTTSAGSDTTPPTLTGAITSSAITQTGYTLSWPTGADNTAVTAYEYNLNGGAFVANGTATTVNISGRTPGSTDTVTVRDKDAAGNVSTPVLSTTVNLLSYGFSTPVLKNNAGTILASETGVTVNIYNSSTGALVVSKTGLTSSAGGIVTVTDPALVNGTSYAYEVILSAGRRRLPLVAAA